ncbi:MAG TPA: phosphotransferase [Thermotogota bacterium]|nr:phosphotransferase [Thermotogota bacterium]
MMKLTTMKKVVDTLTKDWKSPLADQILENWNSDPKSLVYIRSSANFVFRFTENGRLRYLRFNSTNERTVEETENEMEILCFLKDKTPNVVQPVLSKNKRYVELVKTETDDYIAVVFQGYDGKMYEVEDLNNEQFFSWGQALGNLHKAIDQIPAQLLAKRKNWRDHLEWIKRQIPENDQALHKAVVSVEKHAESLKGKTGLIHYDFELDNLHWYPDSIKIFDFDDSAIYWYGADIAYALRELFDGCIDTENPHFKQFMAGYESEFEVDEILIQDLHTFMKLHNLYSHQRISRSLDYTVHENSPDWIKVLTEKLTKYLHSLETSILKN